MKLKDIFPRWALREPQRDGNLELGGATFAHLVEDGAFGAIAADWGIEVRGRGLAVTSADRDGPTIETSWSSTAAYAGIYFWNDWGDDEAMLRIGADGSLRWGDGTAAPDVSLRRNADSELECDRPIRVPTQTVYGHAIGVGDDILLSRNGLSGALRVYVNGAGVDLSVDGDGDLTVNGAKILHA